MCCWGYRGHWPLNKSISRFEIQGHFLRTIGPEKFVVYVICCCCRWLTDFFFEIYGYAISQMNVEVSAVEIFFAQ